MRFEIQPELVTQHKLKWSLSLCMTIPPFAVNTFPVGHAGIMDNKEKILAWSSCSWPGQTILTFYHTRIPWASWYLSSTTSTRTRPCWPTWTRVSTTPTSMLCCNTCLTLTEVTKLPWGDAQYTLPSNEYCKSIFPSLNIMKLDMWNKYPIHFY